MAWQRARGCIQTDGQTVTLTDWQRQTDNQTCSFGRAAAAQHADGRARQSLWFRHGDRPAANGGRVAWSAGMNRMHPILIDMNNRIFGPHWAGVAAVCPHPQRAAQAGQVPQGERAPAGEGGARCACVSGLRRTDRQDRARCACWRRRRRVRLGTQTDRRHKVHLSMQSAMLRAPIVVVRP
jgi:hypothetical protein